MEFVHGTLGYDSPTQLMEVENLNAVASNLFLNSCFRQTTEHHCTAKPPVDTASRSEITRMTLKQSTIYETIRQTNINKYRVFANI